MLTAKLKPGRDKPIRGRHPWVFAGAIASTDGVPAAGAVTDVVSADGRWLARGLWSPQSQIRIRLLTWSADEPVDDALLRNRLERAIDLRRQAGLMRDGAACRLVHAEADGLGGLIVDAYGSYLSVQLLSAGMAANSSAITKILTDLLAPAGIVDRSDPVMREKEGLPPGGGLLAGEEPPADLICTQADGLRFCVDLSGGQKTGAYLDQAANRPAVAEFCNGASVLDAFCYTGGFGVAAARAGAASLTAVDESGPALAMVPRNLAANDLSLVPDLHEANAFHLLRTFRDEGRQFDVTVLDPPKFAHSRAQRESAARGYKDINLLGMKLVRPGGILATFSCSGAISVEDFTRIVSFAASDAGRDVQILRRLGQGADHPILATYPESEYLKGLLCRVN